MARRRSSNSGVGCLVLLAILLIGAVANAAGCGAKSSPSTIYSPPAGSYTTYTPPTDRYVAPTLDPQPVIEQPAVPSPLPHLISR